MSGPRRARTSTTASSAAPRMAADGIEPVIAGVPDAAAEPWQDHLGTLAEQLTKVVTADGRRSDH